ncbi:hypothetical protein N0V88_003609 [Collariella sp. IMI 366227]|nr:hypothetical protein N0V88_003609 [Collariella sp. IMI 366227]
MAKDKRSKAGPPPAKPPAPAAAPPSWPPFKPPLPVIDLTIEPLDKVEDKVVVLRSFFPRSLCRDYVSFLRELPLVTTPGKPKRGDAVRVNDRFQIQDAKFAHRLWTDTGLREVVLDKDVTHLCTGGETVFYPFDRRSAKEEIAVSLETGMCLLHKHGHDCMLHEGREVTAGEKWVIRTDLCVRR